MKDFTGRACASLLITFLKKNYNFYSLMKYLGKIHSADSPFVISRHDVDRLPRNALKLAQIEHGLGIHGTYYFRIVVLCQDLSELNV